jgi:hypothetical protein
MAEKLKSILIRFKVGGFGGIRGPTLEETLKELRHHGFPDALDEKVGKILKELRRQQNSKTHPYLVDEVQEELLTLLRNWQTKRGGKSAAPASK